MPSAAFFGIIYAKSGLNQKAENTCLKWGEDMTFKEYVCPGSLEEAWELNQKKNNRIVAGNMWLRLGKGSFGKIIDLSGLGLDKIEDSGNELKIGAMVTLRELEENPLINELTGGEMKNALKYIVGTQFRNTATVGGSVYSRFGFSDVGNIFMALDAEAEFYKAGRVGFEEFYSSVRNDDILTAVYVKKVPLKVKYFVKRNTATSLPLLNVSCALDEKELRVCIGARPGRAKCIRVGMDMSGTDTVKKGMPGTDAVKKDLSGTDAAKKDLPGTDISENRPPEGEFPEVKNNIEALVEQCLKSVRFGTNRYASAEYRKQLAKTFIRRGLKELLTLPAENL